MTPPSTTQPARSLDEQRVFGVNVSSPLPLWRGVPSTLPADVVVVLGPPSAPQAKAEVPRTIDLGHTLQSVRKICETTLDKTIELRFEVPPGRFMAYADPTQMEQVFLNLLVNAGHAMENSPGSITISTWCREGDVFVQVADSGCGIPAEIRQRIFEPFFTTKEVGKGTGLGLSISYDIIGKHGGEITVESETGLGSSFTVRLPVAGISQPAECSE